MDNSENVMQMNGFYAAILSLLLVETIWCYH